MTRKLNRRAQPKITVNGKDVFVSPYRRSIDLPADAMHDVLNVADRIWKAYQERGGCEGRWVRTTFRRNLPNGITVHESGDWYWDVEPNPFRNISEPHLRAALKAKGYLHHMNRENTITRMGLAACCS